MRIKGKLKTAGRVLREEGTGTILTLVGKNAALYSRRFGRLVKSRAVRAARSRFGGNGRQDQMLHILYITRRIEIEFQQAARYRIFNLMEALHDSARCRFEILENGIWRDGDSLGWADLIVLLRVDWSPEVEALVSLARARRIHIVYDADDVIFLESYAKRFCSTLPETVDKTAELPQVQRTFRMQERTFRTADFATGSTPFITSVMNEAQQTAFNIHNGLNRKQLEIAARLGHARRPAVPRTIAYLSGSITHNQDFLTILPALTRVLREFKDTQLCIVGYLDAACIPADLRSRVHTIPFMSWKRLLAFSATSTINIAPLDLENLFCHAKSELKYFEAAIVGVPTVASATDTYKRCITHGVDGMLASGNDEWYAALKALLTDEALYNRIRENGYKNAVRRYTPQIIGAEALRAYRTMLGQYPKD